MAKRHKHYSGGRKSRSTGRGGSHGKVNHKSKHLRKASNQGHGQGQGVDTWYNSSIPMGGADLGDDIYIPATDIHNRGRAVISSQNIEDYYFSRGKKQSMKMGGLRLNKRDDSSTDLMSHNSSFRKRPMVFVKSTQVYDPSHDLILKLIENNRDKESGIDSKIQVDSDRENRNNHYTDFESSDEDEETYEKKNVGDLLEEEEENVLEDQSSDTSEQENDDLFFIDETGYDNDTQPTIRTVEIDESSLPKKSNHQNNLEFNPSFVIGKVDIDLEESGQGEVIADISKHPYRGYINNIMKNLDAESEMDDESENDAYSEDFDIEEESFEIIENVIDPENVTIEENNLDVQLSKEIECLELDKINTSPNEDFMEEKKIVELDEEKIPEFGFLEEDYVVNTSDITVSNIRLGLHENSYFLKYYRLFGDHEPRWVNQDTFSDFIVEDLGLPEHRLQAYLDYIKDSLIPKEEPPEPTYSDIPFSDSSDDEEEEENDDQIMDDMREGLDDLVNYSLKYNNNRNQEFETKSLEMSGKGKKKKLLIDESLNLDTETIYTLQNKFSNRLNSKANKRRTKEDFISEENKTSEDLFKKFPYGLHIQNMKDEFENFYTRNKERLIFPPLDPHGNKTLMKFAKHYNMKTSKAGKGNHTNVVVDKTRKTKRAIPNYSLIGQLLKQRPVFMRIDVQRVQEDFVKTERIKIKGKFHVAEGEIVGENAPEIGQDNIGRRMLEKLGWNSGEGLGTHRNKGISEPLFAKVKMGKAGLRLSEDKK